MLIEIKYRPHLPPTTSNSLDIAIELGELKLFKEYKAYTVTDKFQVIEVLGKYSINEIHVHEKVAGHGEPVMMIKKGPNHTWDNVWFTLDRSEAEIIALDQIKKVQIKINEEIERLDLLTLEILSNELE